MKIKSRVLTSSNPKTEIWRFLRYFLHRPTTEALIREIQDVNGHCKIEGYKDSSQFFINDINEEKQEKLLAMYAKENSKIKTESKTPHSLRLTLTIEGQGAERASIGYYPDIVDDINGKQYLILNPKTYIHEAATFFILLSCLGNLARYYPDVWVKTINSNSQIAEVTDRLLDIASLKFQNLVLDQMTNTKHYVSKL